MRAFPTCLLLSCGFAVLALTAAVGGQAAGTQAPGPPARAEIFESRIAPLLARRCLECHSGASKQGGLDLTQRATALSGGARGAAVVPGKPDASLAWKRVAADEMPPKHPLGAAEKKLLRGWIAAGAPWGGGAIDPLRYSSDRRAGTDWWSLHPVAHPRPPAVKRTDWPINAIDRFVLAKLEAAGLQPSPPASPTELIRRVTYDLTGLPPTPAEIANYKLQIANWGRDYEGANGKDRSGESGQAERSSSRREHLTPNTQHPYVRLVDRLLASPRYGERWARHWLDVVRYGESQGFERNKLRPSAWKYRDWVVEALNSDMPYDDFVRLQLAGDLLRPDDPLAVIASGFLVVGPYDLTAYTATSPMMMAAAREEELEGLVGTVGQTFLGLTANCARCHDHKFDPIAQREFYRLAAALGGTFHGAERESLSPTGKAQAERQRESLSREIASLQTRLAALPAEAHGDRAQTHGEIERLTSRARLLAGGPAHLSVPKQPPVFHVLARGDFRQKGDVVSAGGIAAVGAGTDWGLAPEAPEAERRKALAAWITNPRNPLTARVMVNRLWTGHFGQGLVRTPNDFGFNGGRPSHPELLDYLAYTFAAPAASNGSDGERERSPSSGQTGMGWRLKRLHRLIVLSATYRQSSRMATGIPGSADRAQTYPRTPNTQHLTPPQVDSDNRLLWRQNRRRLEAEAFRDAALFVSGDLDLRMGGPGYRDWTAKSYGENEGYTPFDAVGGEFNRRTLYRAAIRAGTSPFLDGLDCPDPSVSTPRRTETTTPQQALLLLNNRFVEHTAARWAERLEKELPLDRRGQVSRAYGLAFGRDATPAELAFGVTFALRHGMDQLSIVLLNANEFLYVD